MSFTKYRMWRRSGSEICHLIACQDWFGWSGWLGRCLILPQCPKCTGLKLSMLLERMTFPIRGRFFGQRYMNSYASLLEPLKILKYICHIKFDYQSINSFYLKFSTHNIFLLCSFSYSNSFQTCCIPYPTNRFILSLKT